MRKIMPLFYNRIEFKKLCPHCEHSFWLRTDAGIIRSAAYYHYFTLEVATHAADCINKKVKESVFKGVNNGK